MRSEKRGWGLNGFLFLKRGVYLTCDVFERGLNRGCTVGIGDIENQWFRSNVNKKKRKVVNGVESSILFFAFRSTSRVNLTVTEKRFI